MHLGRGLLLALPGLAGILAGATTACTPQGPPALAPTTGWVESSPEAQGMSSSDLADALEFARSEGINIHSLTVVRNGVMVLDAYFDPYPSDVRHDIASATKSVLSMLVGIAQAEGHLGDLEQRVVPLLPPASTRLASAGATQITLVDLLSMRSGLDCGFRPGEPELREMRASPDWVAYTLGLEVVAEPGSRFGYCSPNFHLLSAAIAEGTGLSTLEFANSRLFRPLGIHDVHWPADSMGITFGWGDLQLQPRDMARLGQLMLDGGRWEGREVLPRSWVEASVEARAEVDASEDYGLGWWRSRGVSSLFEANGRGGQRISVVPDLDLVIVMTGGGFEPGDLGGFLLRAIRADEPLPEDPAGRARLNDALASISTPPPSRAPSHPGAGNLPPGPTYLLGENPLGLASFAVEFLDSTEATLRLGLVTGQELVQPLGLDGPYRVSVDPDGAASAGRAEWLEDGRLRIEFNRLSLINRYLFEVLFDNDEIRITASEPTELGTITLVGRVP